MKLDLHTHCREATACPTPTLAIVKKIVKAVISKGLDGIAITEHYTDYYGFEVKDIVERHCNGKITVIPGKETAKMQLGREMGVVHVVELYLPDDITFRFVAHPGHPYVRDLDSWIDGSIHGIELRNAVHINEVDEESVRRIAERHNLILLSNSDAHKLEDIGTFFNEIDIEELQARAS